jgi:predicted phage tail component-like protein
MELKAKDIFKIVPKEELTKEERDKLIYEDKPDKDFRDFIKGNISMDELFKKREEENFNCQDGGNKLEDVGI